MGLLDGPTFNSDFQWSNFQCWRDRLGLTFQHLLNLTFQNKAKAERNDVKFMTMISSNCPGDTCSVF